MENRLGVERLLNINVEDEILIFSTVYERPPYSSVRAFLKISKKSMKCLKVYHGC